MIDHFTLTVRDLAQARGFYEQALAPLGYRVVMEFPERCGMGDERKPYFWLKQGAPASQPMHIAFAARDRASVDEFYNAALAAGARDDGAPGVRKHYHSNYYGAFVLDPSGHPIEAVCHQPPRKGEAKRGKVRARTATTKKAAGKGESAKAPVRKKRARR